MCGAVRLAPTHEREYLKRLGHVREYHDDEASRTEEQKSCRCRTSAAERLTSLSSGYLPAVRGDCQLIPTITPTARAAEQKPVMMTSA